MDASDLQGLLEELDRLALASKKEGGPYLVPNFVIEPSAGTELVDVGNPHLFYRGVVAEILAYASGDASEDAPPRRGLSESDVICLSFIRTAAAFDGRIGTALSQLAMVPYLHRLGVNVLLTLPTGRIGRANRKGTRGSPFAIADPFTIDASLADPLLPSLDATAQFRLLVQACRLMGIRCGSIVPAATLAIDSPLLARFPEITYWWDLPPGTPLTPKRETQAEVPGASMRVSMIDPVFAGRFAEPPEWSEVAPYPDRGVLFWRSASGLTPATACPDILPDEAGTSTWADVVSLRFADDLVPNLGAVDQTVDDRNRAVQLAALSIAWRAAELGERIFWVDVAERVPTAVLDLASRLITIWDDKLVRLCRALGAEGQSEEDLRALLSLTVEAARKVKHSGELTFIAEELYQFRVASPLQDAVVGPWVFSVAPFTRDLDTLRNSMSYHIGALAADISSSGTPPPFLAGMGDHDSAPPLAELAAGLLAVTWLLPGGISTFFSGHEFGSQLVVNSEFGFASTIELRTWRDQLGEAGLALFNDSLAPWDDLDPTNDLRSLIGRLLKLRVRLGEEELVRLESVVGASSSVIRFRRYSPSGEALEVHLNLSPDTAVVIEITDGLRLLLSTSESTFATPVGLELAPFAAAVLVTNRLALGLDDEDR